LYAFSNIDDLEAVGVSEVLNNLKVSPIVLKIDYVSKLYSDSWQLLGHLVNIS
jgi:hypothetical protein